MADKKASYHLSQRSLGFRWFFIFLLFTRFGRDRTKPNIFLLDEPAANLHAKAQAGLLDSFAKLAEADDVIIYSTHSHHMIRPEWLSGAYIVDNEAIDYEIVGGEEGKSTNITVTPYRRFVGENGSKVSYYQPVLERLEYVEPAIIAHGNQVLVEGISDFYALQYALRRSKYSSRLSIVPGTGSGSLSTMISIALSRGASVLVLLDDDDAGKKEEQNYRDKFYLTEDEVCTLGQLEKGLTGLKLEGLLSDELKTEVKAAYGNADKKSIGHYMAEAVATNKDGVIDPKTLAVLDRIIDLAAAKLGIEESVEEHS